MAHPKRRISRTRGRKRRTHYFLGGVNLGTCSNCKAVIPPHTICPNCGYYGKRAIIQKEDED